MNSRIGDQLLEAEKLVGWWPTKDLKYVVLAEF